MLQTLLTRKEASEQLKIKPDTLRRWEREGVSKPSSWLKGRPRYTPEDLAALLTTKPANDAK